MPGESNSDTFGTIVAVLEIDFDAFVEQSFLLSGDFSFVFILILHQANPFPNEFSTVSFFTHVFNENPMSGCFLGVKMNLSYYLEPSG